MKNVFKAIGWVVLELFTTVLSLAIIMLVFLFTGKTARPMDSIFLIVAVSDIIIALIALLICKAKKPNPVSEWKLFKLPPKAYIMPCAIAFTYSIFFLFISHNSTSSSVSLVTILLVLIISPVSNEIINRGVILNTLRKSFSPTKAIIISAIITFLLSLPAANVLSVVNNVILCVIMAIAYEKTGSLTVTIAAHSFALIPEFLRFIVPEIPDTIKIITAPLMLVTSTVLTIIWLKPQKT